MAGMARRLVGWLDATRLASHSLTPILLAALVFAAIGLVLPPLATDGSAAPPPDRGSPTPPLAPTADLQAFRTLSRWGTDIQSVEVDVPADDPAVLHPELGFIGVSLTAAEQAVLLTHPDGRTLRLTGGDLLPDGRALVAVTKNALTFEDATGQREMLVLFPRLSARNADHQESADLDIGE